MPSTIAAALLIFGIVSSFLFIYHELHYTKEQTVDPFSKLKQLQHRGGVAAIDIKALPVHENMLPKDFKKLPGDVQLKLLMEQNKKSEENEAYHKQQQGTLENVHGGAEQTTEQLSDDVKKTHRNSSHEISTENNEANSDPKEQKGELICNGKHVDSEVIYWKSVPGDDRYESSITPHHG